MNKSSTKEESHEVVVVFMATATAAPPASAATVIEANVVEVRSLVRSNRDLALLFCGSLFLLVLLAVRLDLVVREDGDESGELLRDGMATRPAFCVCKEPRLEGVALPYTRLWSCCW